MGAVTIDSDNTQCSGRQYGAINNQRQLEGEIDNGSW